MKAILFAVSVFASAASALQPTVPKVSLDFWNQSSIVNDNNCYNYGTNRETDSFAQPGEASGKEYHSLDCDDVYKAASADLGLVPSSYYNFNGKEDDTLLALVVSPGYDYHWYRRGDDGKWSHKMGPTPATTLDNSNKEILDPVTADRGDYTEFCGYFRVKNYTSRPDEQNGGYVRIGNMTRLPEQPTSKVILVQYSGRRNPSFALSEYMKNEVVAAQLRSLAGYSRIASAAANEEVQEFGKLGSRGVQIVDHEGLIFPKGSRVQISGTKALVYFAEAMKPVSMTLPSSTILEQKAIEAVGQFTK